MVLYAGCAAAQTNPPQDQNTPAQTAPATAPAAADSKPAQQLPPAPGSQADKAEKEKEIEKQEQSQRVLGVYPQFAVTSRHQAPPLTRGEKFHLFYKSAFDPVEFLVAGIQAGSDQAEDEFPAYGEGMAGFGKRYAADFWRQLSHPASGPIFLAHRHEKKIRDISGWARAGLFIVSVTPSSSPWFATMTKGKSPSISPIFWERFPPERFRTPTIRKPTGEWVLPRAGRALLSPMEASGKS